MNNQKLNNGTKILHITFDYAEENIGNSTIVVKDLIEETKKFADVKVISLNRIINPLFEKMKLISPDTISYNLFGFPYGFFLKYNMHRVSRKLAKSASKFKWELNLFDFVHSHKLTFEGFVGYNIARKFNKKLIVSLRQTDFGVLKYRRDLIKYSALILEEAIIIFFIAPYMKENLKEIFGIDFYEKKLKGKLVFLPNSIDVDNFTFYQGDNSSRFLTILWMQKKSVKRKNILGLFKALSLLKNKNFVLDIIGDGQYLETVKKWSKNLQISDRVNFLGYIKNDEISNYLRKAKAFLLPSFSETLGMVYVESLLCGTPILYSKDTGFDGFFNGVGIAVNPYSITEIADAINKLDSNAEIYKEKIAELYKMNAFDIFRKENISKIYKEAILL